MKRLNQDDNELREALRRIIESSRNFHLTGLTCLDIADFCVSDKLKRRYGFERVVRMADALLKSAGEKTRPEVKQKTV